MDLSPEPSPKQDSEVEVSDQEEGGKEGSGDEEGPSERSGSESDEEEVVKKSSPRKGSSSESEQEEQKSSPRRKERKSSGSESEKSNQSEGEKSDKDSDDEEKRRKSSSTKDIFGSDSDEEEDGEKNEERVGRKGSRSPSVEREGDGEEEGRGSPMVHRESKMYEEGEEEEEEGVGKEEAPQEIRISAQIPRMIADLGSEMYFVKFPNFLSVDTHPFDPSWYEDEIDEDEHKDEEGKKRLKLKVENTIRWKSVPDEEGRIRRESNARMVKWSDGSLTLHLGSETFDVHKQEFMQGENSHLFVRQGLGLQGQAVFRTKLSFRPHSTDSFTHRKMTLSLADKSSKTNKIRVLPNVGLDPEARRSELIKKEEDKLKASIRRENKQKRTRERAIHRGPSAAYLEPDYEEEDEDGAISLSAIKSNYKSRVQDPSYSRTGTGNYSPEQDSGDDSDFDLGKAKSEKKKARIVESDEED